MFRVALNPDTTSVRIADPFEEVTMEPPLPTKTCPVCERDFEWRKKWEDDWEDVRYCSERCRRHRDEATELDDEDEWTRDDEGMWVPPGSDA